MKKITLLLFLLSAPIAFAQSWTTGPVAVASDFSVQFDVDNSSSVVAMTMIGPMNVWLAIAPGVASGNAMGNSGDDVVIFSSNGLEDRNMPAGIGTPNLDGSQDWTLVSNTTSGGVRTIVATRAINTGDSNDFVFPTSNTTFPILWAKGSGLGLGYHASRGGSAASLSVETFETALTSIKLYPNPASTELNIELPSSIEAEASIEVYDVLGKIIIAKAASDLNNNTLNITNLNNGVYLMKIFSSKTGKSITKRFVKI